MVRNMRGVCLLILLAASSFAELNGYPDRELLAKRAKISFESSASSKSQTGSASSGGEIVVSEGEGTLVSTADSEAFATAVSAVETLVKEVVKKLPKKGKNTNKKKYCKDVAVFLEESVGAIAQVGVNASASTFTFVSIDGVGSGCSDANAEAEASATAFAKAVIDAWATARSIGKVATAEASLQSVIRVFAKASAEAAASACIKSDGTNDGPSFAEAYQDVAASAYSKAVASILVWLEAFVDCGGTGDSFVDATVNAALRDEDTIVSGTGGSTIEGEGTANNTGGGDAVVDKVKPCANHKDLKTCCQGRNRNLSTCYCNLLGVNMRGSPCKATKSVVDGVTIWDYNLKKGKKKNRKGLCSC